jgi:large subunit ribosomal protein L10
LIDIALSFRSPTTHFVDNNQTMARTRANKGAIIEKFKATISEAELAFVIDYKGLSVAEITDLRNRLRPVGGTCKIAKNTLVTKAIEEDEKWKAMAPLLKDSSAILLTGEEIGPAIKAYKAFVKDTKKTELKGGVLEGKVLSKADVEALADLPTKQELIAQIAGTINTITAKIAIGIKEVPTSIGRGVRAISEKES